MKKLLLISLLLIIALTGCVGKSSYSCKGVPNGAMCLSVKDAHTMTNGQNYKHLSVNEEDEEDEEDEDSQVVRHAQQATLPEQAVRSLDGTHAVPVRVPAEIMRVWYGPYEGSKGQASFMPGVGYIELAARKWVFSNPADAHGRQMQPLNVVQNRNTKETVKNKTDKVSAKPSSKLKR